MNSLNDLFLDELADVLSAENQLIKALPKMARAVENPELRKAMELHLKETKEQVERLRQVFALFGRAPKGKRCEGMAGLIKEGAEILEEDIEGSTKDAAIIAAAQKIEHYEIATYGTLGTWAKLLDQKKAHSLIKQTIQEEKRADEKLTQLAESSINQESADQEGEEPMPRNRTRMSSRSRSRVSSRR